MLETTSNTLDGVFDFMNFRHKTWRQIQSFQRVICDLLGWNSKEIKHFFVVLILN
jgi:hypothetical protein